MNSEHLDSFFDIASEPLANLAKGILAEAKKIEALKKQADADPANTGLRETLKAAKEPRAVQLAGLLANEEFRGMPDDLRAAVIEAGA